MLISLLFSLIDQLGFFDFDFFCGSKVAASV